VNKTAASASQFASAFCFTLVHVQLQLPCSCASTNRNYLHLIERAGITVFLVINQERIKSI